MPINNIEEIETEEKKRFLSELIDTCNNVEGMKIGITQKTSLAWLVDEFTKENPGQWQNKIRGLEEEIDKRNQGAGKIAVSQFLSRQISEKYLEVLEKEILAETDEGRKSSLSEMAKMVGSQLDNLKEREEKNEATSFGGVSTRRIPTWFFVE